MRVRSGVVGALALALVLPSLGAPAAAAESVVHRVNAGGPAVSGSPTWTADTSAAPSSLSNAAVAGNTTYSTSASIDVSSASIPAGTPSALFQTERYDTAAAPEMEWDLPVPAGKPFEVRLYFAETYAGAASVGARVFDVLVDGTMALDDYDVFARAGGANKGIVERVRGTSDGTVDVDFVHVVENPAIKAIEVVELDVSSAQLAAVPQSVSFGSVKTGTTQSQTVAVVNQAPTGGPSITVSSTSITGTGAGAFSDSFVDGTPVTLTPGSSTAITVSFAPTTVSAFSATMAVSHSGSGSPLLVPLSGSGVSEVPISFGKSLLSGETSASPTSLQFGPDGKLYVAQQNGAIKVYGVARNAANQYSVTSTQTITSIQSIPNHNDNGVVNTSVTTRQVTGLQVAGTATSPTIYVSSSDPRIGGGASGTETGLDTNSSVVSRLSWNGSSWGKLDLVRGLPRSEENHSANGLQLDPGTNTLYLSMGGNTNMGAPSNNFALLPEYALSAAVLAIDLDAIGNTTYDLPTLDDEDRAGADANDPFGGNNGKNQAKLVAGGPVQVFHPGFRNPYDLLRTKSGRFYTIDNGANAGWGDVPIDEGPQGTCTNGRSEPGVTDVDTFHLVKVGGYGGHPNPTRGNSKNTFNSTNPQSPVPSSNAIECDWRAAGPDRGNITSYQASTNGLTEYTASNFGGQLTGDILSASFDNKVYRAKLNSTGTQLVSGGVLFSGVGSTPLDITAQGDDQVFPGTLWVADIGNGNIVAFEPGDYGGGGGGPTCTGANDASLDEDGDGFTNADEIANGTDPCSAADVPGDWDKDKISDLQDPDDDNDGLPDTSDRYALDADNGRTTTLPLNLSWDNEPTTAGGLLNLGFTGLMTNGTSNYRDLFDPNKMTAGGAAGVTTVDQVSEGTAAGATNTQEYGFQTGFVPSSGAFTAQTRILGPFAGLSPQDGQNMGLFLGDGDQDDYVALVVSGNSGGAVTVGKEVDKTLSAATSAPVALPGPASIDLFLTVDPAASTVQPAYAVNTSSTAGPRTALGDPVPIPPTWISTTGATAVGMISTSAGPAPPFAATWDFLKVTADAPTTSKALSLTPATASLTAVQDGANETTSLSVTASDSAAPVVTASSNAAWLSVTPTSSTAPSSLTATADPTGLAPGSYSGTITAAASGYSSAQTAVTFTVTAPPPPSTGYQLMLSPTSSRANPQPLDGKTVSGGIFVFTTPDSGVRQVRFYVDKTNAKGKAYRTDTAAPFDLQGGTASTAQPFDTTKLSSGRHTITAGVDLTNGQTQVVTATITVDQTATNPPTKTLSFTPSSTSFSVVKGGAAQSSQVSLASGDGSAVPASLTSSATWLTASPTSVTTPSSPTVTATPGSLAAGTYTGTLTAAASGYTSASLAVTLTVTEPAPAKALSFTPSTASFSAVKGGAAQSAQVSLASSDGSAVPAAITSSAAWLTASPSSVTTPSSLTVTATPGSLAAGTYTGTITAATSGYTSASLAVTLTISEPASSTYSLQLSSSPDRSAPQPLQAATVTGNIYVFTSPESGVARVRFFLDTTSTTGTPYRTETAAPYDLAGGSVSTANPFNTAALTDGQHSVTAAIDLTSGGTQVITSAFSVANSSPGTTDSWANLPPLPVALGEVASGVVNGKLYVVGEGSNVTLAYDLAAKTWSTVAVRPFVGHHHAAEVVNGKLYLLGGLQGSSEGKVQVYDPATNAWTQGAAMPFAAGSSSSALINGQIYVTGGIIGSSTTAQAARYDVASNTWTGIAPMPQGRNHAAAESDGQRLFVFGGRGAGSGDGNVVANGFDTVQVYDPATDSWQSSLDAGSILEPLPQARGGMGTALHHNGEFYLFGGETLTGAGANAAGVYDRVDIYSPSTNTWRTGAPMPIPRHGIFPVLHDGKMHLAGGGAKAGNAQSTAFDVYTPL